MEWDKLSASWLAIIIIVICIIVASFGEALAKSLERARLTRDVAITKIRCQLQQQLKRELDQLAEYRYGLIKWMLCWAWLLTNGIALGILCTHNYTPIESIKALGAYNSELFSLLYIILSIKLKKITSLRELDNWIKFETRKYTFIGFEHLQGEILSKESKVMELQLKIADL